MSLLLFCLSFTTSQNTCSAQQKIRLTNTRTGKEITLNNGARIIYVLKAQSRRNIGILQKITPDSIFVGRNYIALTELSAIGKKKRGSDIWICLSGFLGGAMVKTAFEPPPCHDGQMTIARENPSPTGQAICIAGGISLVAVAFHSAWKNSPKNIIDGEWKMEIIDRCINPRSGFF